MTVPLLVLSLHFDANFCSASLLRLLERIVRIELIEVRAALRSFDDLALICAGEQQHGVLLKGNGATILALPLSSLARALACGRVRSPLYAEIVLDYGMNLQAHLPSVCNCLVAARRTARLWHRFRDLR